jgi:hypothetical protein
VKPGIFAQYDSFPKASIEVQDDIPLKKEWAVIRAKRC